MDPSFCAAQLGWLQSKNSCFFCFVLFCVFFSGLFVIILPILLPPFFFPLQSRKQLKQQQEEKTNKAPVKQRLNQNKFYVSVGVQRCATGAHVRKKNTNICTEMRPGRQKVSQEVYHKVPSSSWHCSFLSVLSTPTPLLSLVQSQLSTLHNYVPADISVKINKQAKVAPWGASLSPGFFDFGATSLSRVEQAVWPSLNKSEWNQVTTDINYFNNVPFCMEDNEFIHDNSKVKLNLSESHLVNYDSRLKILK